MLREFTSIFKKASLNHEIGDISINVINIKKVIKIFNINKLKILGKVDIFLVNNFLKLIKKRE